MANYAVKQGGYSEVYDSTITLPDDFELITGGPHDIGQVLHDGHLHYLGCCTSKYYDDHKDEFNASQLSVHHFADLVFICIHDIKFLDDTPNIITADEFNDKWKFDRYIIAHWSENFRLMNLSRIHRVESEFLVHHLEVTHRDYFDKEDFKKMEHCCSSLYNLLGEVHRSTVVSDSPIAFKYWFYCINDVLKAYCSDGIAHDEINVDAAFDACNRIPKDHSDVVKGIVDNYEEWRAAVDYANKIMQFESIEFK